MFGSTWCSIGAPLAVITTVLLLILGGLSGPWSWDAYPQFAIGPIVCTEVAAAVTQAAVGNRLNPQRLHLVWVLEDALILLHILARDPAGELVLLPASAFAEIHGCARATCRFCPRSRSYSFAN